MSRYHARRQPYVRQSQQQRMTQARQRRLWIAGGIGLSLAFVAGYFVASHFLHGHSRASQSSPTVFQQAAAQKEAGLTSQSAAAVKQPQVEAPQPEKAEGMSEFSFYTSLPREKVQVDAKPLPIRLEQPVVIVAGTFRSQERAQKELARLARQGFKLRIVPRQVNGRTLYQLRTAPLDNKLDVNLLRNRLAQAGARVLVVKTRSAEPSQSHESHQPQP
ncbi:Sporulation related domain-containing protein [Sulfurivirga caldicuralii]|uniref:Sporulation related domain-containing protein n=1 Tax=Sulfurivirga caldicuralii TaxID=364032 RepID=A0A1N6DRI2_9GAMM|nr:SPOR domain-containing protein [Sulfurivirga caldicuralii]SIN73386.1 Sporulation related domain-containing protein [Sulfurivirga caldicuralii]